MTMLVAFAFSSYAGINIFIANTPQVNPNYLANLQSQFKKNVNNVYLAFSSLNKIGIKKDIAIVYPTKIPYINNMNGNFNFVTGRPTVIPITTKTPEKPKFAQIDPATIPANLFKSISKGVSAYQVEEGHKIYKLEKGATYRIKKMEFNGKQYDVIDLTSK